MKLYSTCYFGKLHMETDPQDAPVKRVVHLIEDTGLDKQTLKDAMDDRGKWRKLIKDVRVHSLSSQLRRSNQLIC